MIKQVTDMPKMAEGILQVDMINSTMNDVEGNLNKWIGMIYQVASLIFLLCAVYNFIDPFIHDALKDAPDGKYTAGVVLSAVIWLYAAFPMTQIIRNAGESISNSSSPILVFVFKDFIVANIRMVGQLMAVSALFGAVCSLIHIAADINMGILHSSMDTSIVQWMYDIPLTAAVDFTNFIGFESIADALVKGMSSWKVSHSGHVQSLSGLVEVGYAFCTVLLVLMNMYISLAIYNALFGMASTFLNFLKSPYIPTKAL